MQTSRVLMVRPASFGYNAETAVSNAFQNKPTEHASDLQAAALREFDQFVVKLRQESINVEVIQDSPIPIKPDALFPNNWFSSHPDGTLILYPMAAENRRNEKRPELISSLREQFNISRVINFSNYEKEGRFLEGTGSIVFGHSSKTAYACRSPRTDEGILREVCELIGYHPVIFDALDATGAPIYHTNVMMCIGNGLVVVGLDCIPESQRNEVEDRMSCDGEFVYLSHEQISNFAGNMIALKNTKEEQLLIMSQSAFNCLSEDQRFIMQQFAKLIPVDVSNIERVGGGSARCMVGELFWGLEN